MNRDICEPLILSDGTYLPKGITVAANAYQINHDPAVLMSDSDPKSFDGLRYYNMRVQLMRTGLDDKEVAGKHQFVSVSNSSMMFGYGKHACPGRFFAGNEIKLILAKLLMTFDIKMVPEAKGRYTNPSWEMAVSKCVTEAHFPMLIQYLELRRYDQGNFDEAKSVRDTAFQSSITMGNPTSKILFVFRSDTCL